MKFITISLLATAISAAPIELVSRQGDAIKDAIMPVMQSLQTLDTAIKGITMDPNTAIPILNASSSASKSLSDAATKIQAADSLGLFGALGLQKTAGDLTTQVMTTINDLVAKKPVLDMLGVSAVALDALQNQKAASGGLSDALLSKVPALARPVAQQSTDKISKTLDDGIAAFQAGGNSTTAAAPAPAKPAAGVAAGNSTGKA